MFGRRYSWVSKLRLIAVHGSLGNRYTSIKPDNFYFNVEGEDIKTFIITNMNQRNISMFSNYHDQYWPDQAN